VYTPHERDRLRSKLVAAARADRRITGAAITGSGAVGLEDDWSDIDLAFGVGDPSELPHALADWTARMYAEHGALHHLDVISGAWVYRVFLLPSTLQVDLAFAPAAEFGARAPTFRLQFGTAMDRPHDPRTSAPRLVGYGWLYALHARACIARQRSWQAEYMISGIRDHALALACLRHGLPETQGRGMDELPGAVTRPLEGALVRRLDTDELTRAFGAAVDALLAEIRYVDQELAARLAGALRELAGASAR
jgi:hypothetical protein